MKGIQSAPICDKCGKGIYNPIELDFIGPYKPTKEQMCQCDLSIKNKPMKLIHPSIFYEAIPQGDGLMYKVRSPLGDAGYMNKLALRQLGFIEEQEKDDSEELLEDIDVLGSNYEFNIEDYKEILSKYTITRKGQ